MKSYNAIYYLLFVLLIMGGFASMAQNSYGFNILGASAIGFAALFLFQVISILNVKGKFDIFQGVELSCLFLLSSIFALRVFFIHFAHIETAFGVITLLLILVYLRKMVQRFQETRPQNVLLASLILIFHLSIVMYLISLATVPVSSRVSEITGELAFLCLAGFVAACIIKNNFLIMGENVSALKAITRFKDHAVLIISLFFLFTLYAGLTKTGIIPKLYSDEYPQAYFEMVKQAESGKELPVNGSYKYQDFKDKYDQYLKHRAAGGK
jgi:hypothetical protein